MQMLHSPDHWRNQHAGRRPVQAELLAMVSIIDLNMALTMLANEKPGALAVRVFTPRLIIGDRIRQKAALRLERQLLVEIAHGQVASHTIHHMAHLMETHIAHGAFFDGRLVDHARAIRCVVTLRTSDYGFPVAVMTARPTYSPMIPSISS